MSDTGSPKSAPGGAPPTDDEGRLIARRKLLGMGAYVAPAVLAAFVISEKAYAATCTPNATCSPTTCAPESHCGPT